jgi:hypothetical protein
MRWTPRATANPRKQHGGPHELRGPYKVPFYLTVTFEVTKSGTLGSRLYFTAHVLNLPTTLRVTDPYPLSLLVRTIYGGRLLGIIRPRRGWMKYPGPRLHPPVTSSIHVRTSSAASPRTPRCGVHNVEALYFKAWPARETWVPRARGLAGPARANPRTCIKIRPRHRDREGRQWGGSQIFIQF